MRGHKWKVMPGLGKEQVAGPSTKWARVASPRHSKSTDIGDEWRQQVIDVLEIVNVEQHTM